jgi:hypothetical protein
MAKYTTEELNQQSDAVAKAILEKTEQRPESGNRTVTISTTAEILKDQFSVTREVADQVAHANNAIIAGAVLVGRDDLAAKVKSAKAEGRDPNEEVTKVSVQLPGNSSARVTVHAAQDKRQGPPRKDAEGNLLPVKDPEIVYGAASVKLRTNAPAVAEAVKSSVDVISKLLGK